MIAGSPWKLFLTAVLPVLNLAQSPDSQWCRPIQLKNKLHKCGSKYLISYCQIPSEISPRMCRYRTLSLPALHSLLNITAVYLGSGVFGLNIVGQVKNMYTVLYNKVCLTALRWAMIFNTLVTSATAKQHHNPPSWLLISVHRVYDLLHHTTGSPIEDVHL